MDEETIHALLSRLLLAGRLPGGTKLGEHRLAEILGVSRERVRKVLHRLGHERLIEVVKNRGAFTLAPDPGEIHLIFEARRILEGGIAAHLADTLTQEQVEALRDHMERESEALKTGARETWLKLSAEFHFLLAAMTGNPIIQQQARELVGRTRMLVAFYENSAGAQCGCDEHRAIFRALAGGERSRAGKAMATHLAMVETRLRPLACVDAGPPLETLIAEYRAELEAEQAAAAPAPPSPRRAPARFRADAAT
ncbi:GntR family transcriptional regulator [Xanthobacter autotrophicus DSM 431]|uniref:GntR family transcriptional regulator n=1 Tax=Xanthobacter nonsaccharivorans TaxID=3119912 RepID=UPI003729282A